MAQDYADWLDSWDLVPLYSERPVAYIGVRPYAGTFDLLAELRGEVWLLDVKTGKDVYESHVLQLAAYRYATHLLKPGGGLIPMPEVSRCGIIHVTANGVTLRPVEATRPQWDVFRAAQVSADFVKRAKTAWRNGEDWPVRESLIPEEVNA